MSERTDAEILCAGAQQVLETMFFSSIMGDREALPEDPVIGAQVSFHGNPSGCLAIQLSSAAARTIASNFLGADDEQDLTEEQIGEVACELANMICGAVLSQIESDSTFEIRHPELSAPGPESPDATTVRCFDLDSGPLALSLHFDRK